MRYGFIWLLVAWAVLPSRAQTGTDGPTDEKARKTYREALNYEGQGRNDAALDSFRKADKQDGGHCLACQKQIIKLGIEQQEWKAAETAAAEMTAQAQGDKDTALAHYQFGVVMLREGMVRHKDDQFSRAHEEFTQAVAASKNFPEAVFADGQALAYLKQDDAAKARFEQFVKMALPADPSRQRASRYIARPELARARMAPPFAITTIDGQHLSLDDLSGKVVLLDFWATWCGPCRQALPHMRSIANNFKGQPLVVLSVSLDDNEQYWKYYVANNEMTWLQYRYGGFNGPVSKLFSVDAIPHTFTIDADGVLQDERIGDSSIEGKLKKLVARAREIHAAEKP